MKTGCSHFFIIGGLLKLEILQELPNGFPNVQSNHLKELIGFLLNYLENLFSFRYADHLLNGVISFHLGLRDKRFKGNDLFSTQSLLQIYTKYKSSKAYYLI